MGPRPPPDKLQYLRGSPSAPQKRAVTQQQQHQHHPQPGACEDMRPGGGPADSSSQHQQPPYLPRDYSLESAFVQSQDERVHDNEVWKVTLVHLLRGLSWNNPLFWVTTFGFVWTLVIGLVAWLWLIDDIPASNDDRKAYTIAGFVISLLWGIIACVTIGVYIARNRRLSYRHFVWVMMFIVAAFIMLILAFVALTLVNQKYTNIRQFNDGSHKETKEEKEKNQLELSKDHHWCDAEKVKAGVAFYTALSWMSVVPVVLFPLYLMALVAHIWPECSSDITDFYKIKREHQAKERKRGPVV